MEKGGGIFLTLSGILACNFFQAAILPGMIFIVMWCYFSKKEDKLLWKKAIPFCFMFFSGLSAVIAPGNYVRHARFSSSFNVIKGTIDAYKMTAIVLKQLFFHPFVILLIILCIYIGIRFKVKNVKGRELFLVFFLSFLTLLLNAFPISLGYATVALSSRIYFLLNFTALVAIVVAFVWVGMYTTNLINWNTFFNSCQIKVLVAGFSFLLLYSTLGYNQSVNKLPWFQTVIATRNVKEIHDTWQDCLIKIRDSEENRIEIVVEEKFFDSPILKLPGLTDDEEYWINDAIAQYYGKEEVKVIKK